MIVTERTHDDGGLRTGAFTGGDHVHGSVTVPVTARANRLWNVTRLEVASLTGTERPLFSSLTTTTRILKLSTQQDPRYLATYPPWPLSVLDKDLKNIFSRGWQHLGDDDSTCLALLPPSLRGQVWDLGLKDGRPWRKRCMRWSADNVTISSKYYLLCRARQVFLFSTVIALSPSNLSFTASSDTHYSDSEFRCLTLVLSLLSFNLCIIASRCWEFWLRNCMICLANSKLVFIRCCLFHVSITPISTHHDILQLTGSNVEKIDNVYHMVIDGARAARCTVGLARWVWDRS